jgi:hypothetical protein
MGRGSFAKASSASRSNEGGQPIELGRFLRLAINLAAGLDKLHR